MKQLLWISSIIFLFATRCICQSQPFLLEHYKIELFSENIILSTVIWLLPAYCLYEQWVYQALEQSVAVRKTSLIEIQIKIAGYNETYVVPDKFSIPQCRSVFGEPPLTEDYVYQVGPDIQNLDASQVLKILPGTIYTIRYVLYNAAGSQIAYTNWSKPFKTRDLLLNPRDMSASLQGRSGGMVVITVILSISMFVLLVGLAVIFVTPK
ncbi:uroplakin-2-like [Mixophyes fleayi]|uniref:uroplakin-2-like n=1 Tax=Mixophyes fleayi TaxID=3061075 RepID=UPI003F4DB136